MAEQRKKPAKLGSKAPRPNLRVNPVGSGPNVPVVPVEKPRRTAPAHLKVVPPRGS